MNGTGVSAVSAYTAHREWASRPPDERYASVHALYDAARARRLRTEERTIETVALRTEAVASDALALRDTSGREAAHGHRISGRRQASRDLGTLRARLGGDRGWLASGE